MKILCINLDTRPDRAELALREFNKIGLVAERLAAVTGDNKPLAFNQSVYLAMSKAKMLANKTNDAGVVSLAEQPTDLLLIEDDIVFDDNAMINPVNLPFIISTRPKDALTIHFGCNIFGSDIINWTMPTKHNETFAKLHNCWQSHCTWYSAECVEMILGKLNPNVMDENNMIFDEWLRKNILSLGRSYVTRPMVAYQRPDVSDIWNVHADYTGCHYAGNEWLKRNT